MKKRKLWATIGKGTVCPYPWTKFMFTIVVTVLISTTLSGQQMNQSNISLNVSNAPIDEVFSIIEKQTGCRFIYDGDILKKANKVNISVSDRPLNTVLQLLFSEEPFPYTLKKDMIIIGGSNASGTLIQQRKIKGVVLDKDDHSLIAGATIMLNGQIRAITNTYGEFDIAIYKQDSILTISSVGFETYKINMNALKSSDIQIFLDRKPATLDSVEVVSNGYMVIPKERSTGSFDFISQNLFQHQSGMDILSRLESIASGVVVDKATSTGGLMIRGLSTINGPKDPLIVVDNFPYDGDIANINPNDVESITILKDAAAASIWGAKAGNGVIVITTKKGKFNEAPKVSFNSFLQTSAEPDLSYIKQINTSDFIDVEKYLFNNGFYNSNINSPGVPVISPVVELLQKQKMGQISETEANNEIDALRGLDVRNQFEKYMYRRSFNQQYALSFQGGTDKLNWITSIGVDKQIGNLNEINNRNNIHFNVNYKPLQNLEIGACIYYTEYKTSTGRPGYGGVMTNNFQTMPYAQFTDRNGNPSPLYKQYAQGYKDTAGNGKLLDWNYYPLEDYKHNYGNNEVLDNTISLNIKYKLPIGVSASLLYQHERQKTDNKQLYDSQSYYARNLVNYYTQVNGNGSLSYPIPVGGILDHNTISMLSNDIRFQVNYDKNWHSSSLNLLTGYELRRQGTDNYRNRYYGYQTDIATVGNVNYTGSYPDYIDGNSVQVPMLDNINFSQTNFISYFANGAFTFLKKYVVSFSARRDASNLFGLNTNDEWNPFWSLGTTWKLSDEKFYHIGFLPYLNVKATYGYSGNIDPSMSAVTTIFYLPNNTFYNVPAARFDNIYNPDLRWETSRMTNFSVEFKTKNNVLNGTIEYYRKEGKDLFGYAPLDYTTGVGTSILKNAADMKGSGWDIRLIATPINQTLKWTITGNISNYQDKVTQNYLRDLDGYNYVAKDGNTLFGVPGNAVIGIYAYKWGGLDPDNGDPVGYLNGEKSKDYATITTSGTSVYDLKYYGSAQPTWFGSVINNFQYKRWELEWSILFKFGYYFHRSSINYYKLFNQWIGNSDFSKRWQKPGDEKTTDVPSMVYPEPQARSDFYAGSEALVDKGDHIRLKYVNLLYRLPLKKKRFIDFYINGADLGIIWKANHNGIDPDYNLGLFSVKPAPTYTFGIRFNY